MTARVGIDTGGTFTDLVALDEGGFRVAKTLSTPREPAKATENALRRAEFAKGEVGNLVHSTTIATNAVLERRGPTVGLITTRGIGDVLSIQRVIRPQAYNLEWIKPKHLVGRRNVREVSERLRYDGSVAIPLDEEGVRKAALELVEQGVEVIAISFLFSFLNDAHEQRAREIVEEVTDGVMISISSEVFPQWREYERTSTCVVDAFLKPAVAQYADDLVGLAESEEIGDLLIMRSNGGAMTPEAAKQDPVSMVRSGPAGGVIASVYISEVTGIENLIIADMGGTSFDTGLVHHGKPALTTQAEIEWGLPLAVPMVDVRSVGAGGGSIAAIDEGGILQVGPRSAGSDPGPACYGLGGTQPTVSDANLVLGRLAVDLPLAGSLTLDLDLARQAIQPLAEQLDRSVEEVALGIIRIADNNMAQALRLVSIDRGLDPRDFSLIAFGGAGPLHAASLARALSVSRVVVPVFPGAFSAFGALIADTRFDYMQTMICRGAPEDLDRIVKVFENLEARAWADLEREGISENVELERSIEMRYAGQNWELEVPLEGEPGAESLERAKQAFHARHEDQFGWNLPSGALELVNFKLVAIAPRERPPLPELERGPLPEPKTVRRVIHETGEELDTPVYWRDDLKKDNVIEGPALVAEIDSTVLLGPRDKATVDPHGNLILEIFQGDQA